MIKKCRYYSDKKTACSLMIDDLVPVAVSTNGNVNAQNDWGYLLDASNSLYSYFYDQIIKKYPEIKGTIFLPLSSPDYIPTDKGYEIFTRKVDSNDFLSFLQRISCHFDTAFHGDKHIVEEFVSQTNQDRESVIRNVNDFYQKTGIVFSGGKFPAYSHDKASLELIKLLHAKWWALDINMINIASIKNELIFDNDLNVVLVPSNVSGDIFNKYFKPTQNGVIQKLKNIANYLLQRSNKYNDPVKYLDYLYKNNLPIIIQEHFQSLRTDGNRQTPSVYDDVFSLDLIYAFLRGKDIWYATCSDIAHYYESYIHTTLKVVDEKNFSVNYKGIYTEPLLSLKISSPKIFHKETMTELHGLSKNDEYWVFDNILTGNYKVIS